MKLPALMAWAAGALLAAGVSGEPAGSPEVPAALRVPKGHKLLFQTAAEGVQIYVSKFGPDGKPRWEYKAPLARLTQAGKMAGYHYAGPSWEADDGSKLTGDQAAASVPAPDPKKDVPWLRIHVKVDGKTDGVFGGVTYVLRLNTHGGVMPGRPPVRAGTEVGVPYRATYSFYGPAK